MRNIKWWKEEQKNKKGGKKSTKIKEGKKEQKIKKGNKEQKNKEGEIIEFEFSWFFWN